MTIKDTSIFELHPNKKPRLRSHENGIILTHMTDLIDISKNTKADLVYDISDENQFNQHFFYFKKDLNYDKYAYHLFFETFYNEIFNYNGCSLSNRSEYLSELTKKEVLNKQYIDYMLVVINGDYSEEVCSKLFYSKIAYYIAGIMNYEKMELKKLKYLEDIIDKEKAKKNTYFRFRPMTHFNRELFKREMLRFKDK